MPSSCWLPPKPTPQNSSKFPFVFSAFSLSATNVENELNCAMLLFWGRGRLATHLPTPWGRGGRDQAGLEVREAPWRLGFPLSLSGKAHSPASAALEAAWVRGGEGRVTRSSKVGRPEWGILPLKAAWKNSPVFILRNKIIFLE